MRYYKGGGSSAPTETTVTNTDLPDYVEPYFKRLLQRGEAESLQGYDPYGGQRLAYFSPDELTSQAMTRGFATSGTPQAYTDAQSRLNMQGTIGGEYTAGQAQAGYQPQEMGATYQAGQVGPTYQAGEFSPQYQAGSFSPGYQARDITSGYDPTIRQSTYQAGSMGDAYTPLSYEDNLQRFMSPYQQNVTDIEKREARRQSEISGKGIQDAATQSGGLGGYREAIMQSERERNLGQQLGDIQARGSQAAFESAQQQLERERAGGLGAAQLGLQRFTAGEGARQTQEQLSQAAFQQAEQSRQQKESFAQAAYGAGESARQRAAELGLNAQQQEEAAKQAQEKFSQSGFQMQQQALQQQGAQGLDAFRAQQSALQQQGAQGIQAYQAGEAARQQAARLGLTASQQNEAARQAQEKFRQSGFDLSSRYNLAAAEGLQGLGSAQQADALSRIQALQGIGSQQRALQQASLDMGYEDFLRQQNYAKQQLSDFGGLLRGVPVTPTAMRSTYQQQPGLFQTAVGAGLSGLGLYRGMGG
jgi:hypothetical protein